MATAQQEQQVSIRPSEFGHGGGLVNDIDCIIKKARWIVWSPNANVSVTAASITFAGEDEVEYESYYSIGKAGSQSFIPSKDGKTLQRIGGKTSLSDGCNFFQFISSLVNAGYPEDAIDGTDLSFMDGGKVHVLREAQPERKGIQKDPGDDREKTVLCISKIYSMKGMQGVAQAKGAGKPAAGKGAAAAGKGAAAAESIDADLEALTVDAVVQALGEGGGSLTKPKLSQAIFAAYKGKPEATKMVSLAFKNEFLAADGRPWAFDAASATVSLG